MAKPVITSRVAKAQPLTFGEMDSNLLNLRDATLTIAGDSGASQAIDLNSTVTVAGGVALTSVMSSSTVTLDLDNTAVTPGAYVKASITVDAQGRITQAAAGSADFVTADARSSISLTVQNAGGGGGAVAPQTFVITVQYDAGTYQNVYYVDGVYKPVLALVRTGVYTFDQSDNSNTNHPLRFRRTDDTSFDTGVTVSGTPGNAGAQVVFIVPQEAPSDLKYYCTVHGNGMGNNITVTSQQGGGAQPTAGSIAYDSATGVFSVTPTSLSGLQLSSEKNIVNGYAGLDATGRVASAQLPSYVDDVEEYALQTAFPDPGETSKIYVALDNNKIFRWTGSVYVEISPSPGSTDAVGEGSTNLYFTTQRARDAFSASTGISITNGAVSINNTAVTAASYTNASITVDAQGRVTAASSGTTPLVSGGALGTPASGNLTNTTVDGTNPVGFRDLPAVGTKTAGYTLATGDVGKYVQVGSGGAITIPNATFAEGDVVVIANNHTAAITITCTISDAYIGGTDVDKATVSLATRGVCNILFLSGTRCIITGNIT